MNMETDILCKNIVKKQAFSVDRNGTGKGYSDNDVLIVDKAEKSSPVANRVEEKYSFKNILNKPNPTHGDRIISNCNKSSTSVESESFKPAAALYHKPLTMDPVESVKEAEEQKAVNNQKPLSASHTEMNSAQSTKNSESSGRTNHFQLSDVWLTPKRIKIDPFDGTDEKKVVDTSCSVQENMKIYDTSAAKAVIKFESKDASVTDDQTTVSLSTELLQNVITLHVRTFIKKQKQMNLDRLKLRTRGMISASNLWKEKVKHLERSVTELTNVSQNLDKQRAELTSAKNLADRTVGIQAGEEASQPSSTACHMVTSNSTPQNPAAVTQPMVHRTGRRGRPPNSSRIQLKPLEPPPQATIKAANPQELEKNKVVNLIDLTDEEDAKKTGASMPVQQSAHATSRSGAGSVASGSPASQGMAGGVNNHIMQPSTSALQPQTPGTVEVSEISHIENSSLPNARPGAASGVVPTTASGQSTNTRPPQTQTETPTPTTSTSYSLPPSFFISNKHPAPLPTNVDNVKAPASAKKIPPKPSLKISKVTQGIVLSWSMPPLNDVEKITSYQLFAYQESDSMPPRSGLWKKVGEVKALPLPMACTLTQFQEGNRYHFSVRAVDQYGRWGLFSDPSSIFLGTKS